MVNNDIFKTIQRRSKCWTMVELKWVQEYLISLIVEASQLAMRWIQISLAADESNPGRGKDESHMEPSVQISQTVENWIASRSSNHLAMMTLGDRYPHPWTSNTVHKVWVSGWIIRVGLILTVKCPNPKRHPTRCKSFDGPESAATVLNA